MRSVSLAVVLGCACSSPMTTPEPSTPPVDVSAAPLSVSSATQYQPSAPPKGDIGTAHPYVFLAAAERGQWVAVCQARADTDGDGKIETQFGHHGESIGDRLDTYLVRGSGAGEKVDALVAHSKDGRYVVVERDGALVLFDAARKEPTALTGSDARDDDNPFGPHAAASFDAAGRRLLYTKTNGVVVRELDSGNEVAIDLGDGLLWRAELDAGGEHVFASMVVKDSDGDGALSLPRARTTLSARGCRGPVMSYGVYGWKGDAPVVKVAALSDAKARQVGEPLGVIAGELIARRDDGALVGIRGKQERQLVDAACKARVVHVEGKRLYFGCMSRANMKTDIDIELPLETLDGGARRDAGIVIWAEQRDMWRSEDILERGPNDKAIMLTTGTVATIPEGFHVAMWRDHVLQPGIYEEPKIPYVLDLATGKRTTLSTDLDVHRQAQRDNIVAVQLEQGDGAALIDLQTLERQGTVPGHAYAIAPTGHVLVGGRAGPLSWQLPTR